MSRCEPYEVAVSTLIDGELSEPELLPTLDHLLDCGPCREFYRNARTLDDALLESRASRVSAPASEDVWRRIKRNASLPLVSRRVAPPTLAWVAAVAAVLVLGIAIGSLYRGARPVTPPLVTAAADHRREPSASGDYVEVVLEQERGSMSERRFVELMIEILRADRDYHVKMMEVMAQVTESTASREGPTEGSIASGRESRSPQTPERAVERRNLESSWSGDRL